MEGYLKRSIGDRITFDNFVSLWREYITLNVSGATLNPPFMKHQILNYFTIIVAPENNM